MDMNTSVKVREFYNRTPFPNYNLNNFKTKADLRTAASSFSVILDNSIPENASIIDVGTGTGQLSAFLSLRRKCVWGIDFSESSLNQSKLLKEKLGLDSWNLKKVDITDPEQIESIGLRFDYVLCLGVLHHTPNAYLSFKNIVRILKPGGYLAIGLYNKFGRIPHRIRVMLANTVFRNNNKIKDYFIRIQIGNTQDNEKIKGWWNDQYLHPHETSHTIGEVLRWFKKNKIEYYQTIPSSNFFDSSNIEISGVWNKFNERYPYLPERFLKQLYWIWKTQHEGGY